MRAPGRTPSWFLRIALLSVLLGGLVSGEEKLLSPDELKALDRQNRMWRLARAEHDVDTNLQSWRTAGFSASTTDRWRAEAIIVR